MKYPLQSGKLWLLCRTRFVALLALLFVAQFSWATTYTVTTTADAGAGSLRQAILDANANAGADVIQFSIAGVGPTIANTSNLPAITGAVLIDGTTQPGFVSGTQSTYIKIGPALVNQVVFQANGVTGITIKGLDLSRGATFNGTGISFINCNQTVVENNFIRNRSTGILINGGQNHTLRNNDLANSGASTALPAISLLNIADGGLAVGAVSGNKFGGTGQQGFRIENMNNLLIGDENVAGAHIVIENNSGMTAHGAAGQYLLYLVTVNNITIDNVDLSWSASTQQNSYAIVVANQVYNSTLTIKNCKIQNRYGAVYVTNGKDVTIQDNDFRGTGFGESNGSYAVHLNNLTEANVAGGILMSGNLWGRNPVGNVESDAALRIQNMGNLVIGDATTGVHIKLEDNSGLNTVRGTNTNRGPLLFENVSNITVDNVDASNTLGGQTFSLGIRFNNTGSNGNITVKNCDVRNRRMGIYCSDGKDYTVTNNDLRGCGDEGAFALSLLGIGEGMISGGVLVHSNAWGTAAGVISRAGLLVQNMSGLDIGDAATGVHIKIEDGSGFNTIEGNSFNNEGALVLFNVNNITVDNIDASFASGVVPQSHGIYINNSNSPQGNVTIKDCDARNRGAGIRIEGGTDYTVTGNDLRGSGQQTFPALRLVDISEASLPGGILAHSNTFGTNGATLSNYGLYIERMNNLVIGDAATGVHIKIEDNSGFNQIAGDDANNRGALHLNAVSNITINSVDCSKATAGQSISFAIRVVNTNTNMNVTIQNCLAGNRVRGIWISGGRDYTVTGNNMVGSGGFIGGGSGIAAFQLENIAAGALAGGILANNNTFGAPNFVRGVVISNMRDLVIGDENVVGANIVLEDNSGLNQCAGSNYALNHGALNLNNVSNVTVEGVDCSVAGNTFTNSYGIWVNNGPTDKNVTIKNCKADYRHRGIACWGGKDYTVQGNTITNSGFTNEAFALDFRDVEAGVLTGGVLVSGNTFGNAPITATNSRSGVHFENMRDLYIGDAATGGNVKLEDGSGLTAVGHEANSTYQVLLLTNVSNSTLDNLDLFSAFGAQRAVGLRIVNSAGMEAVTIKDCNISDRRTGIDITGGKDYTITDNILSNSGADNDEPAVYLSGLVKKTLDGGIAMRGNTFGGANAETALRCEDMRAFSIGDAVSDDIRLEDGTSGLATVGNVANSANWVIYLNQVADLTVNSVDLASSAASARGGGIRVENGNGNKNVGITNCNIGNRRTGLYISGGETYTVQSNNFSGTGSGNNESALYLNSLNTPTGLAVSANTYGGTGAETALCVENMKGTLIGDASVLGRHITLEDGALATVGNNATVGFPVLYLLNVSATTVDNVELNRTGGTPFNAGIWVENDNTHNTVVVQNCAIQNRRSGILISGGQGYTLQNNDLTGSGFAPILPALYITDLVSSAGLSVSGTTFAGPNFNFGLRLDNLSDVIIGDNTVPGVQIELLPAGGIHEAVQRAIHLENCSKIDIELLQLSLTGGPSGTGIYINGGSDIDMRSITVQNRVDGIDFLAGASHTIQCSDLSLNTDGLQVDASVTGLTVEQCSFTGNTAFAINSAATIKAENNFFGGGAPPVGPPNGVTASVDFTPFLAVAPVGCPITATQEIEVLGNNNLIEDGSATPSTLNYTDFGTVKTGTPRTRSFTLNNLGGAALSITSISFSGANAADFAVTGALTPASPIPAGASASFEVTFTPGAAGLRTATLDIANDDPDEGAFDAAVQGTGKSALVVINTLDAGAGSLRQAITDANANPDADVIEFAIGSGAQSINLASNLPTITAPLTIDGTTQPGFGGTPLITVNSQLNGTTLIATGVTGFTVKSMNLSRPDANFDGRGIQATDCNEVLLTGNTIRNRGAGGIYITRGHDYTITNNDLKNTGWNDPAIRIDGVTARNIPGGISMSGNVWGDLTGAGFNTFLAGPALHLYNMRDLIIGNASVPGRHITIEDGASGLNGVQSFASNTGGGQRVLLLMSNVHNVTVDNVDLSYSTPKIGYGIEITGNSSNVTVKNCNLSGRSRGIYCNGGKDYTIQNNDLRNTSATNNEPSLYLNNISEGSIPRGVTVSGNTFGGSVPTALRIDNMSGLLLGDASVVGAHLVFDDVTSGLSNVDGFQPGGGGGHRQVFYFNNVSDIRVENVNLAKTAAGQSGYAIDFSNGANNGTVSVIDCNLQNRVRGIDITGGKDYTLTGNNLSNTGFGNNDPAIYLNGIRPGLLPTGVSVHSNTFGGTGSTALRVQNMDGLRIADAAADVVIEDASGANNLSNDSPSNLPEYVIYLNLVSNITVDDVDLSRSAATQSGGGIGIENGGSSVYRNVTVQNCKIQQRQVGIFANGGKDFRLLNNDLRYSGQSITRPAVYLDDIQPLTLPGGISMSGNLFGGVFNGATANSGVSIVDMSELIISDGSLVGTNIQLEDASGLNEVVGGDSRIQGALYLNNVRNAQIHSVDMSKATGAQSNSFALMVENSTNISVTNNSGANRYRGFYFDGGSDYTVTGNNLTQSGFGQPTSQPANNAAALHFNGVLPGVLHTANGIAANNNSFGGTLVRSALRIDNMKNVLIGDETVVGAHIVLETTSGLNNCAQTLSGSVNSVIYMSNVADITVNKVDASRPSGQDLGGIEVNNASATANSNIAILNCNFNNHRRGIYCQGGRDYTIQNNSLLQNGFDDDEPAIYLQNIQEGSLAGGILMSGNTFGGTSARGGVRFEGMRDLAIGDAATGGNVKLEDGSGLNNLAGAGNSSVYHVLHLNNVSNAVVDNVDVSRPTGSTQDFTGIRVDNDPTFGPITIQDCDVRRHRSGINIQGGKDYTLTGNDLRGSGFGNNSTEPALYFSNITQENGTVPMGVAAGGNLFGADNAILSNCGLRIDNMCGIRISDGSVANSHIALEPADGIKEVTGSGGSNAAIYLFRNSGMSIEKVDLAFTGTQTGRAIHIENENASQYDFTIKDNILKNRRSGLYVVNGADFTVTGNNFEMTGAADNEPAMRMEQVYESSLPGGVSISGNTFGGTGANFGLKFVSMNNLVVSDGSAAGTNVNLGAAPANGVYNIGTGTVLNIENACTASVGPLDLSRAGIVRQGTGLRLSNGMGNTVENVYIQGRDIGMQINGSDDETIQCNALYDNNVGFDFGNNSAIRNLTFLNNSMQCNSIGLRNQLPASFGALNAQNNYWGAASGPTNLGGTGNGYTNTNGGSVNATSFLTAAAGCASALPEPDAFGNALLIQNGDITPSFDDNTLVCGTPVGQTRTLTYSIKNSGGGIILLDGANPVSTTPSTDFSVSAQPTDLELAPGEITTFDIDFSPTGLGAFTATVEIQNRTCDNDPYTFTIKGQGCVAYNATLSGTPAICIGQTAGIMINISGGDAPFTIKLSDGSTHVVNSTGMHTLFVSPTTTTPYTLVQVSDANNCCADLFGSANVTVNSLPTPAITVTDMSGNTDDDGIICADGSATLNAGLYSAWLWNTTATTQSINVTTAGAYTVQVTDANGCTNTATTGITVNANPTPLIAVTESSGNTNNDGILCAGASATLDAGVYTAYAWSPAGNTQTIMANTANTYTVTVTDANGCTATDNQLIVVHPLPAAALSGSLLVCPGVTSALIDLNITAGTAPFVITLSDASVHNVPAAGMSKLTVTVSGGPGPDNFTITGITDANGCAGSGSGMATVNFGAAGDISISGNSVVITDGDVSPDLTDHTDFGGTTGAPIVRTFTITNNHPTLALSISGVVITGSPTFTVLTPPAGSVAAGGGVTTFPVQFAPTGTGVFNATVVVANSDCSKDPYNFAITGEQTCSPPVFSACPTAPIVVGTDAGVCTAVVNYSVTATGTPAPALTYTFTGATTGSGSGTGSGSTFNKGNTTVTVTATNACGAPTCVFTVTVTDNQPPTISCPANINANNDANNCSAVVTYTAPVGADNCPGATTSQTAGLASGAAFPVGTTTNTFTVTAANSQTASCSFTVTVTDNQPPTISCPANINANNDAGNCSAVVTYTAPTGADNCPGATTSQTAGLASGAAFPVGTTTNTFTVTAANSQKATCSFTVTVTDNQAPTISCPANINVNNDAGNCSAVVTYTAPTGADNCPGATTAQTAGLASGAAFPVGTTTNTFTVTAANSQTASCSFTVTVTDNQPPTISCPANINVNNDAGNCSAVVTYTAPTGADNCPGATTSQTAGLASGAAFPVGTTTNTFTVTAANSQTASCSFTVTVTDNQPPTISCPANINVNNDAGNCSAVVTYTAPTGADNCPGATTSQTAGLASGSAFPVGTTTNTFTVTAANAQTASCSFTVTVTDNQAPTISCPANINVNNDANNCSAIVTYTAPVGADNCPGATTSQTAGLASGAAFPVGTTTNTFTVTAANSQTASCSFTVTVTDNQAPTISCPANINANNDANNCSAVVTYTAPTGADNCPSATTSQTAGLASGAAFPVGTTTNTFTVTAANSQTASCSFTVTVTDNQPPTISCPANINVNNDAGNCSAVVTYTAPTGADNCPGATTSQTAGLASGSAFPVGTTTNTFTVTAANSQTASCSFTVTVTDNQAPTISCPANINVNNDANNCSAIVTYTAPVGADNCPGATTSQTAGLASGAAFPVGTTTNTFTVTAANSQTASCSFTITVTDNQAPTISCPANINVNNDAGNCSAVVTYTAPFGADNCPGATTSQTAGLASGAAFPVGTTTNTFTVTAANSQTASCSFTVTVTDNQPPTISCPANINVNNDAGNCSAVVTYTAPVGADNCPGATTSQTAGLASGAAFPVGTTTNTFTVTAANSQTATCSFTVTVTDNQAPTISCPANINVNNDANNCSAVVTYTAPTGADNCPGATTAQTAGLVSGAAFPVGTTTNTFTVTAANSQTASCSFTVTVTDNQAPTISCPANINANNDAGNCSAVVTYTAPTGADNCPGATTAQTAGLVSGAAFPVGTTTNTFTVTAANAQTASCSFTVMITDDDKPTFTCPTPTLVLNTTGGANCQVVIPDLVALVTDANDNCALRTTNPITQDVAAGNYNGVSDGMTIPVTVTVTDNASPANSETCTITFTVNDDDKPTFTCPTPTLVLNTTGGANCQVVIPDLVALVTDANDNCALKTTNPITQSIAAGNYNGVSDGMTIPVTVTVTDNASPANSESCTITFTVNDDDKPTFTCPTPTLVLNTTGGANCQVVIPDLVALVTDANDNCALRTTNPITQDVAAGNYNGVSDGMTIPVVVTVTDNASPANSESCTITFTVNDDDKPTFTCPTPTLVLNTTGGANCQVVIPDLVALVTDANDNCALRTTNPITQDVAAGNYNGVSDGMTIPVVVTVTDNASPANSESCTITFTVNDDDKPTFTCPTPTLVLNTTGGANCQVVIPDLVALVTDANDNCALRTTNPITQDVAAGNYNGVSDGMTIPVVVTVTDNASPANSESCTITFTVNDDDKPTFTCPTPTLVLNTTGGANCQVVIPDLVALVTDANDNCALRTTNPITQDVAAGNYNGVSDGMTIPVVVTVTDNASPANSESCTITFTVNDDDKPTFTCPTPTLVLNTTGGANCQVVIPDLVALVTDANDNCALRTTNPITQDVAAGNYNGVSDGMTIPVTVTVTDNASPANSESCTITFTVNDDDKPTFTCPTPTLVLNTTGGANCQVVIPDLVALVTDANDNCALRTTNPITQSIAAGNYNGVSDGMTIPVTVTVTDNASPANSETCTITFTVNDDDKPTFTCPTPTLVLNTTGGANCQVVIPDLVALVTDANDNCALRTTNPITQSIAAGNYNGVSDGMTIPVTVTVTDNASPANSETCTITFTVNDDDKPTFTCPTPTLVLNTTGGANCQVVIPDLVALVTDANDNCALRTTNPITQDVAAGNYNGVSDGMTIPVTVTVTDNASPANSETCTITFTVNDDDKPTFTCPTPTLVLNTTGGANCQVVIPDLVALVTDANDNCALRTTNPITQDVAAGNYNGVSDGMTIPVVVTVTDNASPANSETCTVTFEVNDDDAPVVSCPVNQTANTNDDAAGNCSTTIAGLQVSATDNCDAAAALVFTYSVSGATTVGSTNSAGSPLNLSGIAFSKGLSTVNVSVADANTPTANVNNTCSFTVTVNDNENPTLSCPNPDPVVTTSSNGTGDCTGTYTIADPLTDNCPGASWSAAFSGNANGNPTNLSNIADGNGSGAVTFQKGVTTVVLSATDAASNAATTCSFTVTVNDDENPTLICPNLDPVVTTSSNGTGDCTGTYTIADPLSDNCPGATWSAAFSGNANGNPANLSNIADGSGSGAITFQKGTTTVVLSATDAASNVATTCTFTVTVNDNENPALSCPIPDPVVTTSSNGTGDCTGTYTIADPLSDNCPGATWSTAFSGNANGNPTNLSNIADGNGSGAVTFQKGVTTVVLSATDAASNTAMTCSFTVTVNDNENPTLSCPSPNPVVTTSSNGTGDCTGTYTIADPLTDNCPGATWSAAFSGNANGNPTNLSNIADGSGSGAITFQKGVTTVVLSATDAASNAAIICSFTVTVNDNENPTLSCPNPDPVVTTSSNGTGDCTGTYTIADPLSDNCPGATWSAAFSGNANGNPTNLSNIADGSGSGAITFQKGVTTVILSATDAASNVATTCSFTVTVNDDENPTLSCPSPNPVVTTSSNGTGDCTGTYTIADPLTDNCPGASWSAAFSGNANGNPGNLSNIADGNGSGAVTFQKGVTTVVLSATDAASNAATTCSFTVTVVDIEGPAFLTCPSAITICTNPVTNTAGVGAGAPGDNGYIAPASIEATASDNCGLPLVTYTLGPPTNSAGTAIISGGTISLPIGATVNPGTTTVTYTVDDGSNNTASCSFTITVRRTPLPSFSQSSLSICDGGSVNLASYARDSRGVAKRYNFYEDVGGTLVFLGTVTATSGNVNFGQVRNVVPSGDPNVPVVHTYYLTAQNLFANGPDCESLGGPLTVTVNPRPAPPAVPADISFCPGATVNVPAFSTATPPGVTQFAWSNNNPAIGLAANGTANASVVTAFSFTAASNTSGSPLSATISVQAIAGNCASNPSAFNLVLRPAPVGVPAAPAICSGQSVNHSLQASPAATFSWVAANNPNVSGESLSPQSGPAITDLLVNNSSTVQTVVYTVTPTSTDGCPGAAFTVSVSVNPLPVLTPGLSVQVCEGENASLVLTDVAGIATGFSWVQQPLPANVLQLSGATNGTGSPITGSFLVTGSTSATINYTVTSVAGGCPGAAATASIVVDPGVVNALTLNACETAVGSGVSSFDLGAALPGAVFYDASLTQIGSVYTGAATTLYAFSPIPASVCSLETIITLNVNALPSANVLPSASEICLGSDILLEGNPTGGTSPYLHNRTATLGAASVQIFDNADGTATVTGIAPGTATLLYTVSDANGCSATSSATVEVKALPQVTALVNQTPGIVPVCEGSSVSLSCTIVPVQGTSTVQWTGTGFSSNVANPPPFPITTPGPNVFEVVVTDANGCSASASVTVQVDTLPFPGNPNNNGGIYCIDDLTPFNLFDILVAQAAPFVVDPSGVWTGVVAPANGNLGTIVPASLPGIGTYSFTYGVTHPDGCNVCVKAVVTIEIVDCSQPLIYARPKMLLQGPYNTGTGLMNDGLRSQGLVPLTEPYSNLGYLFTGGGGESIPVAVLNVTGPNAIVDWVVVELRSATNPGTVIFSRSALLQRDGDVVDLDGVSPVGFMGVFPGTFHVSVKHRNHLGVITPTALNFSLYVPVPTDYTSASNPPFGGLPGASLQLSATTLLMYGGDANFNGQVQNTDEVDFWAQEVGQSGYRQSDYNMDGQVQNTDQVFIWVPNSGRGSQIPPQ